jgi:hypothetical protein
MGWFGNNSQGCLNYRFSPTKGVHCLIVERPGLWMEDGQRQQLLADLRQVAERANPGGPLDYGIFFGDPQVLDRVVITLLRDRHTGQPFAFNAMTWMSLPIQPRPMEVLHLGLVLVDPGQRQRGFTWILYGLTCFLLFIRHGLKPIWVSNVTQVPAVVGSVAQNYDRVHPDPRHSRPASFQQRLLARAIMAHSRSVFGVGPEADFDAQRFVITNAYTGGSDNLKKTLEQAAMHRDPRFNAFCAAELDYQRGDDVLQIGQINLRAVRGYLLRSVPPGSLASAVGQLGFALVSRGVLPLVHWFMSSQRMGDIRPWKHP